MIEIKFDKNINKSLAYDNDLIIGECEFLENANDWNIVHTEVNNEYQGQGIARKLVECIIYNADKNNKTLRADCSYARRVIESK